MAGPLLQLTDCHVGAEWGGDPLATLRTVIDAVLALPVRPTAALVTGDLTNNGIDEEYAALAPVLAELGIPLHVIPGNHDDRATLRRHFDVPGAGAEPIQYVVELDGLRVVMLDTTRPGEGVGELGPERLAWLEEALVSGPAQTTLLAMHHPPFRVGIPDMDRYALAEPDRAALSALVRNNPRVCGMVAGHVHRTMTATVGGRVALSIPTTFRQFPLDLAAESLTPVAAPLAFALHTVVDGRVVSHVETLPV